MEALSWQKSVDGGVLYGPRFDRSDHDLLIAKLHCYSFKFLLIVTLSRCLTSEEWILKSISFTIEPYIWFISMKHPLSKNY